MINNLPDFLYVAVVISALAAFIHYHQRWIGELKLRDQETDYRNRIEQMQVVIASLQSTRAKRAEPERTFDHIGDDGEMVFTQEEHGSTAERT